MAYDEKSFGTGIIIGAGIAAVVFLILLGFVAGGYAERDRAANERLAKLRDTIDEYDREIEAGIDDLSRGLGDAEDTAADIGATISRLTATLGRALTLAETAGRLMEDLDRILRSGAADDAQTAE